MPGGLSTARSARSSERMDTGPRTSFGRSTKVEPTLLKFDKLRYRLMPYLYSLAWKVTNEDYTIQRPLVMDWRTDPKTWDTSDEFMFGPALLVNPVLKANATKRNVYLPAAAAWYDFLVRRQAKRQPGGRGGGAARTHSAVCPGGFDHPDGTGG